jgi:hypothetical protein
MKQGSGRNSMAGQKREPIAHAINPAGVSQIGSAMGNHATEVGKTLHGASVSMDRGRGFEAPKDAGRTVHHNGSQGKR